MSVVNGLSVSSCGLTLGLVGVTNDKFPWYTPIGVIHKGVLKNHNIANNYHTNVIDVSFCC